MPVKIEIQKPLFSQAKADRAIRFIENLELTTGEWKGRKFELLPWQHKIISDVFGTIREDGYRQYNTVYIEIPKKNGKALALDTPLPTPSGWTTMGEVKLGDELFDEQGHTCRVTHATRIQYGHPCYEVVFEDDSKIIADESHLWLTSTYKPWLKTKLHTTKEIAETLAYQNGHNHKIANPLPLILPSATLPIDPYILGYWLGDGRNDDAEFTMSEADYYNFVAQVENAGYYTTVPKKDARHPGTFDVRVSLSPIGTANHNGRPTLIGSLRDSNLLNNKHIPSSYLRASYQQRLSLLQGLMDSDGYVSKAGQCEFTTTESQIASDVLELLITLGFKRSFKAETARLYGKDCGLKYRIQFWAYQGNPVFKLKRKLERQKLLPIKYPRNFFRKIVAVNPVESVPVKCIQVDSYSHLYLAGEGMVPTHNTEMAAAVGLYLLFGDNEPGAQVYCAAADKDQAGLVYGAAAQMIRFSPALSKRCKVNDSRKRIWLINDNSFMQTLSSEVNTKHGLNVSGVVIDELHAHPNRKLYEVLTKGSGDARRQPLFFIITTAGIDRNSVCWELHEKARAILNETIEDPTFYPVIYGPPDDEAGTDWDWTNEENWYKVNPSLGHTIQIDKVRDAFREAQRKIEEENTFKQLRLNIWVKQSTRWIKLIDWDKCGGKVDIEELKGKRCYSAFDLSSSGDLTALAHVFPVDDKFKVLMRYWIPADMAAEKEKHDRVPYARWVHQGYVQTTPGNLIDYAYIRKQLNDDRAMFDMQELAYDPWGTVKLLTDLQDDGFVINEKDKRDGHPLLVQFRQGYVSMSPAAKGFMDTLLSGKLEHGDNPVLRWNADSAVIAQDPAGNIKPDKSKATQRIDGVVSLCMALDRAVRHSNKPKMSIYETEGVKTF